MSKELKRDLILAVFVGIGCGIQMGIYQALNVSGLVENPLYWASYLPIPAMFLFGANFKDIPFHWGNALFGVLCAFLCNALATATAGGIGFPVSMSIQMAIWNFVIMAVAGGIFAKNIGRCPMAVLGFIGFFAAGGTNLLVLCVSLICGIVSGVIMVQSGKIAAKMAGIEEGAE